MWGTIRSEGIIRSEAGQMIEALFCEIKVQDALEAELWARIWGFKMTWDGGFRRIMLISDSI